METAVMETADPSVAVVIYTDDKIQMRGLESLLDCDGIRVVKSCLFWEEVLESINLKPDVVLIKFNGTELIKRIKAECLPRKQAIRIVVFSHELTWQLQRLAKEAGADGVIDSNKIEAHGYYSLSEAVRVCAGGNSVFDGEMERQINSNDPDELTVREYEVLCHIAKGNSNKNIAAALCISIATVKQHVKSILSKLDAESRTDAVYIARKRGLIE